MPLTYYTVTIFISSILFFTNSLCNRYKIAPFIWEQTLFLKLVPKLFFFLAISVSLQGKGFSLRFYILSGFFWTFNVVCIVFETGNVYTFEFFSYVNASDYLFCSEVYSTFRNRSRPTQVFHLGLKQGKHNLNISSKHVNKAMVSARKSH